MAGTDKNSRRVDTGRGEAQSSKSVSKAENGSATVKSQQEQDAEWGFDPKKSGMAVEAKMGMAIVVILLCAFSFLVYHKFNLRQMQLLQADAQPTETELAAAQQDAANAFTEFYPDTAEERPLDPQLALREHADVAQPVASQEFIEAAELPREFGPSPLETVAGDPQQDTLMDFQPSVDDMSTATGGEPEPDPFGALAQAAPEFGDHSANNSAPPVEPDAFAATFRPAPRNPAPEIESFASGPTEDRPLIAANDVPRMEPDPFPSFDPPAESPAEAAPLDSFAGLESDFSPAAVEESASPENAPFDSLMPTTQESVVELSPTPQVSEQPEAIDLPAFEDFAPADVATADSSTADFPAFDHVDVLPPVTQDLHDYPDVASAETPVSATDLAAVEPSTLIAMADPVSDFDSSSGAPRSDTHFPLLPPATDASVADSGVEAPLNVPVMEPSVVTDATQPESEALPPFPRLDQSAPQYSQLQIPGGPMPQPVVPQPVPRRTAKSQDPVIELGVAHMLEGSGIQQVAAVEEPIEVCDVQPKDTYWAISKRMYGTPRYFSSLALYNRHRIPDPKKLRPGMKVLIPTAEKLESEYPELFPERNRKPRSPSGYFLFDDGSPGYRIGADETLSEISLRHLGRASRWMQIYQLNRTVLKDPNRLKPGSVIRLPQDATDVHMAP